MLAASAPRTSLGCLYADVEIAALRAWMASGQSGPALALATPGSGLTTLVRLLIKECGLESVWIGCSTPRIKTVLEQAGANPLSVTMRRKIVVIDEFDALSSSDATASSEALAFARSKPPVAVLFASHATRSQKALEFAKHWPRFAFARLPVAKLAAYLSGLAHGKASEDECRQIADAAKGDVRAAVMALDLGVRRTGPGPPRCSSSPLQMKDEAPDGLDLTEALLTGQRGCTVPDCLKVFGMEPAMVPMGLFENYLSALDKTDMRAAELAADGFSMADCVDKYLYSRQAWDVHDMYGVCSIAVPTFALRCHRRVPRPPASFGITKFGSVWSKMYNMCTKAKHVRALATRYAEAGLLAPTACDLAWVRQCLKHMVVADGLADPGALRRLMWPLRAGDVLHLARLDAGPGGSTWYKQAVHARIKKILEQQQ